MTAVILRLAFCGSPRWRNNQLRLTAPRGGSAARPSLPRRPAPGRPAVRPPGINRSADPGGGRLALPLEQAHHGLPGRASQPPIQGDGRKSMPLHTQVDESSQDAGLDVNPVYVHEQSSEIPRYRLPERGVLPRTALQVVRDELILDGNARLNLATFVPSWSGAASTFSAACGTPRPAVRRPAAPPPGPARPACWAGWRCCGAGMLTQ